ncbi:hypothetical protein RUND412_008075 [Rhizina undulata]
MKFLPLALVLGAALVDQAAAHYRFYEFIANGVTNAEYEYIRINTNTNSPVTDVTSTDLRCNVGGLDSAATTDTLTVAAGSTVGFHSDIAVFHPGAFNIYMAKAPSTAAAYDGSGTTWFRVWERGPTSITTDAVTWDTTDSDFTFTIPSSLPSGQYLVRIEHIALHSASTFGGAQFYVSCAQINVTGGGSGTPAPLVAIPGVYTGYEPGILINIYWPIPTNYTIPGPILWSG